MTGKIKTFEFKMSSCNISTLRNVACLYSCRNLILLFALLFHAEMTMPRQIEAPKAPIGVGYVEGCPLRSRLGSPGSAMNSPQRGSWRGPGWKRIFVFLRPQNAAFCTFCRCFEFVKQYLLSHLGARPRFWGPTCRNVELLLVLIL